MLPSQLQTTNSPGTSPCRGQPPQRRLQHRVVIGLPQTPGEGKLPSLASHALPAHHAMDSDMQGHCPSSGKGTKAYAGSRPLLALEVLTWFCIRHFQWQSCAINDSSAGWLESCLIVCNLQAMLELDLHELQHRKSLSTKWRTRVTCRYTGNRKKKKTKKERPSFPTSYVPPAKAMQIPMTYTVKAECIHPVFKEEICQSSVAQSSDWRRNASLHSPCHPSGYRRVSLVFLTRILSFVNTPSPTLLPSLLSYEKV